MIRVQGQGVRRRLGEPHVGQHHRPDHGLAGERHPQGLADGAVHPVGADHVARADQVLGLAVRADDQLHPVREPGQPGDFGAVPELGAEVAGAVGQHPFGLVLRGAQHVREPAGQPRQAELRAAEEPQLRLRGAGGHEFVGHAAGVQLLQRAGVHGERPGQVGHLGVALEHHAPHPGPSQVTGQQQPGRARAHDHHVGVDVHLCPPMLGPPVFDARA
jgi:hypothetical protein